MRRFFRQKIISIVPTRSKINELKVFQSDLSPELPFERKKIDNCTINQARFIDRSVKMYVAPTGLYRVSLCFFIQGFKKKLI